MKQLDYNSVTSIRQFLESEELQVSKRLGQNFLMSPHVREKICDALGMEDRHTLWEIGPGLGAMTEMCLRQAGRITVFELDYGFVRVLEKLFGGIPSCTIVPGDFLDTGIPLLREGRAPDRLLGNLPYSSGSAMVYKIVEVGNLPECTVFTLQREVVRRMTAAPGTKEYSLFSLVCGFVFHVEDLGDVAPGSFYPVPEVYSRIVRLTPHGRFDGMEKREVFFSVAKSLFRARRKTIKNNLLSSALSSQFGREELLDACREAGIRLEDRGERLSVDEVVELSSLLAKLP